MISCNWYSWHIVVGNVGGNIIKREDKIAIKLSIKCIDDKSFYTVKLQVSRAINQYFFQIISFECN